YYVWSCCKAVSFFRICVKVRPANSGVIYFYSFYKNIRGGNISWNPAVIKANSFLTISQAGPNDASRRAFDVGGQLLQLITGAVVEYFKNRVKIIAVDI